MTTNHQEKQSCFARMLDVRTYVIAARSGMHNASPSTALFMVVVFGLIALLLLPLWIVYDLSSTWQFTTGLRDAATPTVIEGGAQVDAWLSMSIGSLLAGLLLTSFTLLPSLFEIAVPAISHPLLNLILLTSIVFDYVTDWPKSWELTSTWSNSTGAHFLYTVITCGFVSVGVQAILICCLTVVIFGLLALLGGGARQAKAVVIEG
jgi:hypothetical protein